MVVEKAYSIGDGLRQILNILIFGCFVAGTGAASAASFTNKPLIYHYVDCNSKRQSFTFPFVESDDGILATRINSYLHILFLEHAPPEKYQGSTNEAVSDSWGGDGFREIKLKAFVLDNGGRVLKVVIYSDTCAAFKSFGETTYSFDTKTGRLIVENDLLTAEGTRNLAKRLFVERRSRLKKEIKRLERLLSSGKKISDPDSLYSSIELYEQCLDNRFKAQLPKRPAELSIEFAEVMTLGDGYITFGTSSCSTQANAALDHLGDFDNKLSAEELRPYLSSYGKYILFGEGDGAIEVINPYAQVFRGKINGTIPITLYLLGSPASLGQEKPFSNAKYYYDKYRTMINLSVARKGDLFELTETDSKETPKPVLSFKIIDDKLVGQWRGAGKTYSFEAAP